MNCIKLIYRIALVLFLFTSLAINITMFAWQAGAQALSGAYSALSRTPAVITGLTQENSKLLASNKRLTTKIDTNKRTVKQLSNKIVKRTWRRTLRNIAGVVPEAIPYVGIFAIVGLTALDIKDACATMRDMKELNAQFDPDESEVDERDVCGVNVPSVSEVMAKVKSSLPEMAKAKPLPEDDYNKLNDDWNLNLPPWNDDWNLNLPSWNDDWNLNLPSWKDAKKLLKGNDK